jgi:hypothetical protein
MRTVGKRDVPVFESRSMIKVQVHGIERGGAGGATMAIINGRLKTGFLSVRLVYSAPHEGIAV